MHLEPSVSLSVDGKRLTPHQLEVLRAVYETGSQKAAAARLGIATPVLHRYLHQIEAKVGAKLVDTTPRGTVLNAEGEELAQEYMALRRRMDRGAQVVIGGTIITEELVLSAVSAMPEADRYDVIISDDERNVKDFQARMMDLVVLDDPLYAYDIDGVTWQEVGEDRLLHQFRGASYGRFRYGAQRLGFRHLQSTGQEYHIERTETSLSALLRSNLSFFVNESLAMRKGLPLRSATDPDLLKHKILAVYWQSVPAVDGLLRELSRRRLGN